jgi:hypothetical protein
MFTSYKCIKNEACEVTFPNRNCRYCRFAKCTRLGMSLEASKLGRKSNISKQHLTRTYHHEASGSGGRKHKASEEETDNAPVVKIGASNSNKRARLDITTTPAAVATNNIANNSVDSNEFSFWLRQSGADMVNTVPQWSMNEQAMVVATTTAAMSNNLPNRLNDYHFYVNHHDPRFYARAFPAAFPVASQMLPTPPVSYEQYQASMNLNAFINNFDGYFYNENNLTFEHV